EAVLLDRSAQVRRAARVRARTLGVDVPAVYGARLPAKVAVLGLGETGAGTDVELLVPLLGGEHPAPVRRAAVRSLMRLAPVGLQLAVLPPLLESEEATVVGETARRLGEAGYVLDGDGLDRLLASSQVWTRRASLGLTLRRRRGWAFVVAALS